MSAYIVNNETISVIVKAFEIYRVTYKAENYILPQFVFSQSDTTNAIGQSLLDQNYKSVNYRYGEEEPTSKFEYKEINLIKGGKLNTGLIVGCIENYEYQACETKDYFNTYLHYSLVRLKEAILKRYIENDGLRITWGFMYEEI